MPPPFFQSPPPAVPVSQSQEWLARYAGQGDQAAFASLVRAQSPLVWRTAMRRLGDAQLAEEAVQNVFLALARKAEGLASRPGLSAWLHRAAVLEASALARSRARRERRHLAQASSDLRAATPAQAPDSAPVDSAVGLLLDEALSRLPELDRAVLLGRYFEERSYEELGGALGKTGAAVKKRTQRALEKIAAHLRRRGVGLSAGAAASLAAADFSRAALSGFPFPSSAAVFQTGKGFVAAAGSARSAATASVAGADAAAIPSVLAWAQRLIFLMSTTKATLITAALLLLLLGLAGWQSGINAASRQEILERRAALQKQSAAAQSRGGAAAGPGAGRPAALPEQPLPDPIDGMTLVRLYAYSREGEALMVEPPPPNWPKDMEAVYKNASTEEILRLIQEASKAPVAQSLRLKIIQDLILSRLPDHDPALALRMAAGHGLRNHDLTRLMSKLAEKDQTAAEKLLGEFMDHAAAHPGNGQAQRLMASFGGYFVSKSDPAQWRKLPPALVAFADRHLGSGLVSALILGADGDSQGSPVVNALTFNPGPALDLACRVTDPEDQKRLFTGLAQFHLMMQPNRINPNADGPYFENGELRIQTSPDPEHPERNFAVIPNVLEDPRFPAALRDSALQAGAGYTAAMSGPWAALDAVRQLSSPDSRAENLATVAEKLASIPYQKAKLDKVPEAASPEGRRILDQTLADTASALAVRQNPDLARTLAEKIGDPGLRAQALRSTSPSVP